MELEEGEAPPPPPPPPPGDMVGPARPPAGVDVMAYPSAEEFVQANVAYQVALPPSHRALALATFISVINRNFQL